MPHDESITGKATPESPGLLRRMLRVIGLNRSVALAGGPRLMGMILGPVGSFIIVYTLGAEEQGMYYVFLSLLGLRTFFELGATACIGQMTPHHLAADGHTPEPALVAVANRWMRVVAGIFGAFALAAGAAYLWWCGYHDLNTQLLWAAAVIPTALNGIQEGRLQLLYGAGRVDEVSAIRWQALIAQYVIQWSLLLAGASLLSFSLSALGVVIGQQVLLHRRHPWLLRPTGRPPAAECETLREELGALVKRAGIVYLAGYFVLQIQQPILFRIAGAEASARFGFTLMVLNSLIGLASLWGMTAFPGIARTVSAGEVDGAFRQFRTTWLRAAAVATAGLLGAVVAVEILKLIPRFHDRLMPIAGLLPLGVAIWLQTLGNCGSYWPRAFKAEPFAPTAILQMIVTPPAVWLCIRFLGADGVGWANLASWILGGLSMFWIIRSYFPQNRGPVPS